jgi:cytochrome P450
LRLIAQAQLDKLITVGWKSPEETTEQAERDRRAWDAYVKKQVEDERREIGKWLAQNPYLDALLKGERR